MWRSHISMIVLYGTWPVAGPSHYVFPQHFSRATHLHWSSKGATVPVVKASSQSRPPSAP